MLNLPEALKLTSKPEHNEDKVNYIIAKAWLLLDVNKEPQTEKLLHAFRLENKSASKLVRAKLAMMTAVLTLRKQKNFDATTTSMFDKAIDDLHAAAPAVGAHLCLEFATKICINREKQQSLCAAYLAIKAATLYLDLRPPVESSARASLKLALGAYTAAGATAEAAELVRLLQLKQLPRSLKP